MTTEPSRTTTARVIQTEEVGSGSTKWTLPMVIDDMASNGRQIALDLATVLLESVMEDGTFCYGRN